MNCMTCIFANPEIITFMEHEDGPEESSIDLVCWRNPPQVFLFPMEDSECDKPALMPIFLRPSISEQDWCGEYKSKDEKNDN